MSLEDRPAPLALRVSGLRRRYGKVTVLDGLHLTVREGEVFGLLGRNGAGKTTAIRIVMGIITGDAGETEILGEVAARPTRRQKQGLGYVSQAQHFYPWMTCRVLARFVAGFYPTWDQAEFERLLDAWDLPGTRKVSALSHGMQVKLALALAFAHRPRLLILDEPTAGLDPAARREFLEIVRMEARRHGCATLFSSHIVEEVERISDRIGILHRGRLCYEGNVPTLKVLVRRAGIVRHVPALGDGEAEPAAAPAEPSWPPAGLAVLEDESTPDMHRAVLMGPEEAWRQDALTSATVTPMSLEDIFLALTVGRTAPG